jgi:fatty acid amide hydrolase 2
MGDKLAQELDKILGDNGVLLYPSHSTPAPYHGQPLFKTFNFAYTAIFNVLGNPVTQVPLGIGSWGVPLGIQVVAARNQDRNSLAVALQAEKLLGGWIQP